MAHAHAQIAFPANGRPHVRMPRRRASRRDPRLFGRAVRLHPERTERRGWTVSDDAKLFAATFAGGFLFVSILIA